MRANNCVWRIMVDPRYFPEAKPGESERWVAGCGTRSQSFCGGGPLSRGWRNCPFCGGYLVEDNANA